MTKIIHLSDLHFGAHDPRLVDKVEERIDAVKPDLVVISGDFTQRARTEQFQEACEFLTRLGKAGHEVLGVPGNHDIPLYDVLRRFLSPLTRYKRYIDETLCPYHDLPKAAVLGINTARSLTFKDGRVNEEQVAYIRDTFRHHPDDKPRVLVTHHPLFALPVGDGPELGKAVGRQEMALAAVADAGVDLLLAGHNHRASTHRADDLVTGAGNALVIQAGTATSTRLRDEEQSFNLIDIAASHDVSVAIQAWDGSGFADAHRQRFLRQAGDWQTENGRELAQADA
ncbi:metallophosphoesterase family protein [Sphingomonas jaspsi]|uniref:metallophosphoesterase family protein n=1 Tax=Sphingomonas jaspsi TaxID=392409 RepID=UPI00055E28D4|nr:metallophosphoesterase [Sphingomonas jaspsi]